VFENLEFCKSMGMSIMLFGRVIVLILLPDLSVNTCSTSICYLSCDAVLEPGSYFSSGKDSIVIS